MSWTDQHQIADNGDRPFNDHFPTGEDPDDRPEPEPEDRSHSETASRTGRQNEDRDNDGDGDKDQEQGQRQGPSLGIDEPLAMTQCPFCDGHDLVSKKLVYEEFHYAEDGALDAHHNRVRAEFELTCMDCGKRLHELPDSCRTFYGEVWVLKQDLRQALRRQLKLWDETMRELFRW